MPAFNAVGNIANSIGLSSLAHAKFWSQDVSRIDALQLHAFVTRMSGVGRRDEAETALEIALGEVMKAVARNEFDAPPMLAYFRPDRISLTAGELRIGLQQMDHSRAVAVLFALEVGIDNVEVARLTHRRLTELRADGRLTELALKCVASSPRHVRSAYVFWNTVEGKTVPLFGLDLDVFDAFGVLWGELESGYQNLVMIDGDADRASLECYLNR